jgi:hypothetical protein
MLQAFEAMCCTRADADPCLYHKWDANNNLCLRVSWIDDCLIVGDKDVIVCDRNAIMQMFECDDVGPSTDKNDSNQDTMILTQPVLIHSFVDEFGVKGGSNEHLPAKHGQVLTNVVSGELWSKEKEAEYRKGLGKIDLFVLLDKARYSQCAKRTGKALQGTKQSSL